MAVRAALLEALTCAACATRDPNGLPQRLASADAAVRTAAAQELEAMEVGLEFEEGGYWTRTRATSARRFFQRYGSRLRWSRVAGRYLVV